VECCGHDSNSPYQKRNKQDLLKRLKRIEGQVRGIHRMVDEDKYCVDIIDQITAARAALGKVQLALLDSHIRGCVSDAIKQESGDDTITELISVLTKFTK